MPVTAAPTRHRLTVPVVVLEDNLADVVLTVAHLEDELALQGLFVELRGTAQSLADLGPVIDGLVEEDVVVVIDLDLPDSTGVATWASLRAALPHQPMVVHSGSSEGVEAVRAAGGAACHKDEPAAALARAVLHAHRDA